jgi:hypothetical protein
MYCTGQGNGGGQAQEICTMAVKPERRGTLNSFTNEAVCTSRRLANGRIHSRSANVPPYVPFAAFLTASLDAGPNTVTSPRVFACARFNSVVVSHSRPLSRGQEEALMKGRRRMSFVCDLALGSNYHSTDGYIPRHSIAGEQEHRSEPLPFTRNTKLSSGALVVLQESDVLPPCSRSPPQLIRKTDEVGHPVSNRKSSLRSRADEMPLQNVGLHEGSSQIA